MTREEVGRWMLSEFLGFMKFKLDNGGFTMEECTALLRLIDEAIPISATVEDLAGYYGRSEIAVRSVISRKMLKKPTRRVMYDFKEFRRVVPDKWKK